MKKLLISMAVVAFVIFGFGMGVYAAENWLDFNKHDADETQANLEEIELIINQLNDEKITAEQALTNIEDSYQAMVDKVGELHHVIHEKDILIVEWQEKAQEKDAYIQHLEQQLIIANNSTKSNLDKSQEILENAREMID